MTPRRGLHGAVVDDLGLGIVQGRLPEGTALVPEEIGARHGVSRTVVRETLRVLESKGLVLARPNVGTRVLPSSSWHSLDADVIAWQLRGSGRDDTSRHLRELRRVLEPAAAGLAAIRATRADVARMRDAYDAMLDHHRHGDTHALVLADIRFHEALLAAAANPLLAELSSVVAVALDDTEARLESEGFDQHELDVHGEVLDAVAAGDAQRAEGGLQELMADSDGA